MPPLECFPTYQLDNIQTPCYLITGKAALRTTRERVSGNRTPVLWGYEAKVKRQSKTTHLKEEDIT